VELQRLRAVGLVLAERDAVGEILEVGSAEVDLELVVRLRVEPGLHVRLGDRRVHVHDEHGAAVTGEHAQVVDVELAVLACQRRVEMM
jgi:hypothetical protein